MKVSGPQHCNPVEWGTDPVLTRFESGGPGCPSGKAAITSLEECRAHATALAGSTQQVEVISASTSAPPGCYRSGDSFPNVKFNPTLSNDHRDTSCWSICVSSSTPFLSHNNQRMQSVACACPPLPLLQAAAAAAAIDEGGHVLNGRSGHSTFFSRCS